MNALSPTYISQNHKVLTPLSEIEIPKVREEKKTTEARNGRENKSSPEFLCLLPRRKRGEESERQQTKNKGKRVGGKERKEMKEEEKNSNKQPCQQGVRLFGEISHRKGKKRQQSQETKQRKLPSPKRMNTEKKGQREKWAGGTQNKEETNKGEQKGKYQVNS